MKYNRNIRSGIFAVAIAPLVILLSCTSTDTPKQPHVLDTLSIQRLNSPHVTSNGEEITLSSLDSSLHLIETESTSVREVSVTTTSPARIVFSTTSAENGYPPIPIFESTDLTQLFTDYTKTQNDLARAKREVERLKDLFSHSAVAGKEVIQAESDLRAIQVGLVGLQSRLLGAGLAPNELTKLAPNIFVLISNVPESEISNVQLGEDAQIEFDAYKGQNFHGRVVDIGKALDPSTRTFNVRINLGDKNHSLRPGMFGKASFGTDITKRFVVPSEAVVSVQGKSYVFVKKDEHCFIRREVNLGSQTGNSFILISGLKQGELVVTRGSILLKGLSFGS